MLRRLDFLQWFGNIVTMDWWDDLWLNEGFASFFEYIGVEEAEKDWGMVRTKSTTVAPRPFSGRPLKCVCASQRDVMIINDVLPVMVDDALVTSHPIIVNVSTPAQITSVFDSISYSKVPALSTSTHTGAHTGTLMDWWVTVGSTCSLKQLLVPSLEPPEPAGYVPLGTI